MENAWNLHSYWLFVFKNRKYIIPILLILIFLLSFALLGYFWKLKNQITSLSKYEVIQVLAFARDLNIGDVIGSRDLKLVIFYKAEFEKMRFFDSSIGQEQNLLVRCHQVRPNQEFLCEQNLVGRVLQIPVRKGTLVYQQFLAPLGTSPGVLGALEPNQSVLDLRLEGSGYQSYVKPNDYLDLHDSSTQQFLTRVKVLMINSNANNRLATIAVPFSQVGAVAKAIHNRTLVISLAQRPPKAYRIQYKPNQQEGFSALMIIKGSNKELIKR